MARYGDASVGIRGMLQRTLLGGFGSTCSFRAISPRVFSNSNNNNRVYVAGVGSGGGRGVRTGRHRAGYNTNPSSSLTSAVRLHHSHSGSFSGKNGVNGKNSNDSAKLKGINLNTQTMLKIADSDSIMNILNSLDVTNVMSLIGSSSEGSGLNALEAFGLGSSSESRNGSNLQQSEEQQQQLTIKQQSNGRLFTFIEAADPTQSFLDLSLLLDEPVEEVSVLNPIAVVC